MSILQTHGPGNRFLHIRCHHVCDLVMENGKLLLKECSVKYPGSLQVEKVLNTYEVSSWNKYHLKLRFEMFGQSYGEIQLVSNFKWIGEIKDF